MTVGIPGTGLGGLFYFLLVALMPFRELFLTLHGRSSLARWRSVAFHLLILGSMLGVLWGEAWLLERALEMFGRPDVHGGAHAVRELFLRTGQFAAITSFAVLAALLAGVAALRFTPLAGAPRRQPRLAAGTR
ncbi:MAG TPA: hypothetical protein VFY93_03175 [Planctomycetota bacterium]|nr:hypothetical protein [Planctomycetota bacterium]